jgi:hypothetical protein
VRITDLFHKLLNCAIIDGILCVAQLENPSRQIVRIFDRENESLLTRIWNVVISRIPSERSVTPENPVIRAANQSDRIRMSVTAAMKCTCFETVARPSIQKPRYLVSENREDCRNNGDDL